MLSIFDRIEIAVAVNRGAAQFRKEQAQYRKEQRRANRAAGKKNDNGNNPDSNTGNSNLDSDNNNNLIAEEPKMIEETSVVTTKESQNTEQEIEVEAEVVNPKTEQEINAEAEAPVEPIGAEIISNSSTIAEHDVDAAMAGIVRVDDNDNPNVMDFSEFGVSIDLNKMNGDTGTSGNLFQQEVVQPPVQQPLVQQNPINPVFDVMMGMNPEMQQFNIDPMAGMDTYNKKLNHQQPPVSPYVTPTQIPAGFGHHKIDNPQKPKPPKGPKSKPDVIDTEGMPDPMEGVEVTNFNKIDARRIGIVEDTVSMEVEPVKPVSIFKQNETLYPQYPYLAEIEKIALDKGYQIGFALRPNTNLIECHICNETGKPIPGKGFVIDPGMIIDHRKKIFPTIQMFYEGVNAYPLYTNGESKDGKKNNNVLNTDIIVTLIVGGNMAVKGIRGMYTEDFKNLNKFVALITIPTNKIGPQDRKYIQNRLVDLYKSGTLADALLTTPGARFRIAEYNKGSGAILLDTDGVPGNFGGMYVPNERIQLKITKDKCKTLRGDNIIDIPESQQ